MRTYILFFVLVTIFFSMNLFAQKNPNYKLDKVVVTASRVPLNMADLTRSFSIISNVEIQNSPVNSIQDILQYAGGVDIQQRGTNGVQADISIRGGTFEQTLILIDGIKVSDPQTAHHNLNLPISSANIERIEILKGQGSRMHGPNSFSGAVNIITRKTSSNFVSLDASGGENGYYSGSLSSGYTIGNFSSNISLSKTQSDGYRHNTNFETLNFNLNSSYRAEAGVLNFMFGYNDNKFGANGFYSNRFPNQWEHTRTNFANLSAEFGNDALSFSPKIFWRRNNDRFLLDYEDPSFYENNHQTDSYGIELQTTLKSGYGVTALGGEFSKDEIESSNLGNHKREKMGFFAEHNLTLTKEFNIILGGFLYDYSEIGWKLWPGIDAGYNFSESLRMFASVGKAFRIPTFTELYYSDPATSGNPNLQHEETLNYEIGFSFRKEYFTAGGSLFRKEGTNLIDWIRDSEEDKWQAANIAEVNSNGFELNFLFNPKLFLNSLPIHNVKLSYTYIDSDKSSAGFESRYVLNHLEHQLNIGVSHSSLWGITHNWYFRYEDRVNYKNNFIVDLSSSKQFGDLNIYVKATNLFNKSYSDISGIPLSGRWVTAGMSYSLAIN